MDASLGDDIGGRAPHATSAVALGDASFFAVRHWFATKNGDDVFDGHDEELVIRLKIDRNRVLGMKKNVVVLLEGEIGRRWRPGRRSRRYVP